MPKAKTSTDSFGKRLREARELRGLKQRELGELVLVPASSIAHFEAGRRKPSFDNLQRLTDALNISADYLLGHTDSPTVLSAGDALVREVAKLRPPERGVAEAVVRALIAVRHKPG